MSGDAVKVRRLGTLATSVGRTLRGPASDQDAAWGLVDRSLSKPLNGSWIPESLREFFTRTVAERWPADGYHPVVFNRRRPEHPSGSLKWNHPGDLSRPRHFYSPLTGGEYPGAIAIDEAAIPGTRVQASGYHLVLSAPTRQSDPAVKWLLTQTVPTWQQGPDAGWTKDLPNSDDADTIVDWLSAQPKENPYSRTFRYEVGLDGAGHPIEFFGAKYMDPRDTEPTVRWPGKLLTPDPQDR